MAYTSLKSGLLFDDSISTSTATSAVAYQGTSSTIDFAGGDTGAVLVTFNPQSLSSGSSNVVLLQGSMLTVALVGESPTSYRISVLNGTNAIWTSSNAYDFGAEHTVALSWSGLTNANGGSLSVYLDGLSIGGKDVPQLTSTSLNTKVLPSGGYNGFLGMLAGFTSDVSSQLASLTSNPSVLKYANTAANRTPTISDVDGVTPVTEYSTVTFPSLAPTKSITVAGLVVTNNNTTGGATATSQEVAAAFASGSSAGSLGVSGSLSGFVAGALNGSSVIFTSAAANQNVTDIQITSSAGVTVATPVTVNGVAPSYETDTVAFNTATNQAPKIGDTIYISDALGSVNKSYTFASSDLAANISGLVNAIGQKVPETQVLTIGDGTYAVGDKIKITYYKDASATVAGTSPEYTIKASDVVTASAFAAVSNDTTIQGNLAKAATLSNIASGIAQLTGGTLGVYKVTYDGSNKITLTESSPAGVDIRVSEVVHTHPTTSGSTTTYSAVTSSPFVFSTSQEGGSAVLSTDGSYYRISPITSSSTSLTLTSNTAGNKSNLSIKYIDASGVQQSALGYAFDLADQTSSSWQVMGLGGPAVPAAPTGLLLFGNLTNSVPSNQSSVSYGGGSSSGGGAPTPSTQTTKTNGPIYAELIPSTYVATSSTSATVKYNLFLDRSQDATPSGYNSFGYTLQVDPAVATLPSTDYFSLPSGASFQTVNDAARTSGSLSVQWVALAGVTNYKTPVGTLTLNVPLDNGKAPANIGINFSDISLDNQYFTYATTGSPSTSSTYAETLISDAYPVTFTLQRNYDYTVKTVTGLTTSAQSVTTNTALKNPGIQGTYVDYQVSNKAQNADAYLHVEQATPVTATSGTRGLDISVHAPTLSTGETRTLVIDLPSNFNYDTVKFTPTTANSVTTTYVSGSGAHSITLVQTATASENLGTLHVDVAASLASPTTSTLMFNSVSKTLASVTTVEAGIDLTSGYGVTDSTGSLVTPALPRGTLEYVLTDPALSKANTDKITVEDARAILGLAAGNPTVTALGTWPDKSYVSDLLAADFNNDGRVTGADVINLMNYVVSTTKGSLKWIYMDQSNAPVLVGSNPTAAVGTKTSFQVPASLVQHTDVGLAGTALNTMTPTEIKLTGVLVGDLVTSGA